MASVYFVSFEWQYLPVCFVLWFYLNTGHLNIVMTLEIRFSPFPRVPWVFVLLLNAPVVHLFNDFPNYFCRNCICCVSSLKSLPELVFRQCLDRDFLECQEKREMRRKKDIYASAFHQHLAMLALILDISPKWKSGVFWGLFWTCFLLWTCT